MSTATTLVRLRRLQARAERAEYSRTAVRFVRQIGEDLEHEAIDVLVDLLDSTEDIAEAAVSNLVRFGEEAVPALYAYAKRGPCPKGRDHAYRAIHKIAFNERLLAVGGYC
jgi:hypothetical protein